MARAQLGFIRACELDVAVRKPGNVSRASAGHGMQAALFSASARASAAPLFRGGARVGDRIEAAVAATWAAVGCNTNLGILLLCAPVARAVELQPETQGPAALRAAIEAVLADLDLRDARAAYRAIAAAHPGGLGAAPDQDVHAVPSVDLRAAMALAAERDSIARQYRDGYVELFEIGLPPLSGGVASGFTSHAASPSPAVAAAVQRVYLAFMAHRPDSHIVRKHGAAVAHSVMRSAQAWQALALAGADLDADPDFAAWDLELKAAGLNPGTSADLTVATLLLAGLLDTASPAR
ncbi:MAG: triphosphoribosyl-dephospho-CoA synthase [Burkholderiales bacterium]